ncbi:hypothetical protein [Acinetobacter sp. YH12090]|uniref:hypothetical protein n=1 Tax=Acinetobacter sp. YH12090 TaxID=2601081 RepID=UPI0015D39A27|nr:hypothetical protein [Acinetobacter sp. YH12090]
MIYIAGIMITFLFWHISVVQKNINDRINILQENSNKNFSGIREEYKKKIDRLEKRVSDLSVELHETKKQLTKIQNKDDDSDLYL